MKHIVKIEPAGIQYKVHHNAKLHDELADYGIEFPCGGQGICGNCKIKLLKGRIVIDELHAKILIRKGLAPEWRIACLSCITEDVTIYIPQNENAIQTDASCFHFLPERGYGIAVDLGSTTLVVQLVNLQTGGVETTLTSINPQSRYGADIISRISFAQASEENAMLLCSLIRSEIQRLLFKIIGSHRAEINQVIMVGNSVMHHLFCHIDISPLANYPFQSPFNQGCHFTPDELAWPLDDNCRIYFSPNVGHFVGSDILAGIEATRMHQQKKYQMLLDLGTNGEIVVGNLDVLLYTSTAAGPAFEGINISQGMRASTGAIYGVEEDGVKIIGNGKATGICGSGLIDAVAFFLERGEIDINGAFVNEGISYLHLTDDIKLTDKDVCEFQLAKAAIETGIYLLLEELNITMSAIEHIYLTGGLGHYLNINNAKKVGLLHAADSSQVVRMNNAALLGAKMLLFKQNQMDYLKIQQIVKHCPLESNPNFQDIFFTNLFFSV